MRTPSLPLLTLLVLAAGALAGCAELGIYRPGDGSTPEALVVELRDTRIDVRPHMVARGRVALDIVNAGTLEHGVRVVGPGTDDTSDEFLVPGQRRRLVLTLGPGTFRIFCPDGDHGDRGMWAKVVVTERPTWFRR